MKIYAFDFDGTLTTKDTLIELIRFAKGSKGLWGCLLKYSPLLVLMKLHLYSNAKAKEKVFAHCFSGMSVEDFDDICQKFAKEHTQLLRPQGMRKISKAIEEGSKVVIVSASIDRWVKPFFVKTGSGADGCHITVCGTEAEVKEGKLTGRFATANCHGQEKVNRLLQLFPNRKSYRLIAFGDSHGDAQLLDYADEAYYKPFRGKPLNFSRP